TIPKTKLRTTLIQFVILTLAQTLGGLRWVLGLAILHNIVGLLFQYPLATPVPWWTIIVGYVLLASSPGRVLVLAVGVRLLRIGITPGRHPRGGRVHLQLSACERLAGAFGIRSLSGTRWAARYARAIGCGVGRHVDLRATVPVTGWVTLGDDCAVEPGADLAGHWIDGGVLHVGPIHVGERARIGGRSTLLPGAHIGDDAVVEPGTCVDGRIPAGEVWAGSPAECVGIADDSWPAPVGRRSWWWGFVYTVSLFAFSGVPLLAAVPGLVLLGYVVRNDTTLDGLAWHILAVAPLGTLVSILSYTTLLALTIRLLGTPVFNVWARTLGVKIGKWVWLESHWLPETDLIRLGDGVTINRGCVLQTHLFHDRLMRISPVHMGAGSSLGPKSIALPGTSIGAGARIGAGSLVMRGEHVPAGTRWTGNPIVAVDAARSPQKTAGTEVTAVRRKPVRPASVSRRVL
ncbi:MAG: hypothetical protein QOH17_3924, partial [Pseudonocardiales bacterium]|nr:hypothetical protein [Pseudonocardiales bacterium]